MLSMKKSLIRNKKEIKKLRDIFDNNKDDEYANK
jgi:hypothetical protein